MTKKVFAILLTFILMLFTTSVFATNEMGDSMNKAGNTVRNVVGGTENVVEDVGSGISTGIKDLGNTFTDGAARITTGTTTGTGYTATRTGTTSATTGNFLGMSSNMWTWLILSITTIAIVALVWYYAMQQENDYTRDR